MRPSIWMARLESCLGTKSFAGRSTSKIIGGAGSARTANGGCPYAGKIPFVRVFWYPTSCECDEEGGAILW
jgi:hypothetical protein